MGNVQCTMDGAPVEATAGVGSPSDPKGQSHRSSSFIEQVVGPYRAMMRFLGRRALARATLAVPRTLRFMGATARSGEVSAGLAAPNLSLGLAAGVAMDEALLAMAMTPSRFPRRADFARVSGELADARRLFSKRGWIARPASYHRTPPPLACQGCRDHPWVGHSAWAMSGSPSTAGSRPAPVSPGETGGWRSSPTVGRRLPSSVTAGRRAPGSSASTGSAWATPSWTSWACTPTSCTVSSGSTSSCRCCRYTVRARSPS